MSYPDLFAEARAAHLAHLDDAQARLRALAADPCLCNPDWDQIRRAGRRVGEIVERIARLNAASLEAAYAMREMP